MAKSPAVKLVAVFAVAASTAVGCASQEIGEVPDVVDPGLRPATVVPGVAQNGVYIVVLKKGANANAVENAAGASATRRYSHALNGFAAPLSPAAVQALAKRPDVLTIEPDTLQQASSTQTIPTGVRRMGGVAGIGENYAAMGVAVIDTGVSHHADLNVLGGANFSKGSSWADGNGHGTHVAGTIAAKDNELGVIGVAPGAAIWAVRVLDNRGSGWTSDIIAGVDWVTANKDKIAVANMSLGGSRTTVTKHCNSSNVDPNDAYHTAICGSVAAGVTYVVAAGNENKDACTTVPAGYGEVITVSALADFDGAPGGLGSGTYTSCNETRDDSFACFSNYGSCVDVMAPGVAINSTWNDGGYKAISGTSMASPHVAGAAVRYLATNAGASPTAVRAALIAGGDTTPCHAAPGGICDDDPDTVPQEPLVLVGVPAEPECASAADCADDSDLCTDKACVAGKCTHVAKSCNDGDACTTDSCDPGTGSCVFSAPIAGCGGEPPPSTCTARGASCTVNADCCSNNCGGKPGSRTCR